MDKNQEFFLYQSDGNINIDFAHQIKTIYKHINGNKSKKIFENRLLFSLTDDNCFLRNVLLETKTGTKLLEYMTSADTCIIYGAGRRGRRLQECFPEANVKAFLDMNSGGSINNIPIINPKSVLELYVPGKTKIIVSCQDFSHQIHNLLISFGIKEDDISSIDDWNILAQESMYFEDEYLCRVDKNAVDGFVDGGSLDGQNTSDFYNWSENEDKKVFLFEPDTKSFNKCKEKYYKNPNVKLFNCGVFSSECVAGLGESGNVCTGTQIESEDSIRLVSLDNALKNERVGFIKLDIEGSELEAIKGAQRIISEQHPIMAVSVYHKREDIWTIPSLLLDYNPNYKFYFGHYNVGIADTVLYAID